MTEQDKNEETFDNEIEEQTEVPHKGFEEDTIIKSLRETQEKQIARREESEEKEENDEKDVLDGENDTEVINKTEQKEDESKDKSTERSTDDYPTSWKGELKDKWESIDPDVKAEIHRREGDMLKGLEQYRTSHSYAQDVANTFKPYDAEIKAAGSNQKEVLEIALNTMYILRSGSPDEKANELLKLAATYGVQLENLNSVNERIEANMPLIDPAVEELKRENVKIMSFLQQSNLEKQQEQVSLYETEIDKFEADPANKHFADVREEMARIFGSSQDNENLSLQEAYDNAVWANPVTREKLIAERRDTERREEAVNSADAKRTAKTNVASRGQPLTNAKASGTLEDTLKDVMAEIRSRR